MRKMLGLGLVLVLVLGMSGSTIAKDFVPPLDRRTGDQLKKVYSELKVGMSFSGVRDLAEKYYPQCRLQDIDVWTWNASVFTDPEHPFFSLVLGVDPKMIPVMGRTDKVRMHRIILRVDFGKEIGLINAVYVRYGKNFKNGDAKEEERTALLGDGYYQ